MKRGKRKRKDRPRTRGRGKKTFLECMFTDLDDIHEGSDEQVEKELSDMGIDLAKSRENFLATLAKCREELNGKMRKL